MSTWDFILRSDYAPLWVWGIPGLQCLVQFWFRFLWWKRVQHMAHTLALSIFFFLLGAAFIAASLMSSRHAIIDFAWLLPAALVTWFLMQVTLLVANVMLGRKLMRVDQETDNK